MACPTNKETIKNGIINHAQGLLVMRTGINEVNRMFGEELVSPDGTINPSEQLIDKYLSFHKAEQEKNHIISDLMEISTPEVSDSQKGKVNELLYNMGVKVEALENIQIDGQPIGQDGIALPLQALVAYAEGKQDALPEEAFHIAVEMISQVQPGLFNKMLTIITTLPIYAKVTQQYSNNPQYQKDGKADLMKLKKEAIAKQLVKQLEQEPAVKTWWDKVISFLKGLFTKSNVNLSPFQDTLDLLFRNEIGTVRDNLLRNKSYLISQGLSQDTADQVIALANSNLTDEELRLHLAQITPTVAYYSLKDNIYEKLTSQAPTGFKDFLKNVHEKAFELFKDVNSKQYKDLVKQFEDDKNSQFRKELNMAIDNAINKDGAIKENLPDGTAIEEIVSNKLSEFKDGKVIRNSLADMLILDNKGVVHIVNFFSTKEDMSFQVRNLLDAQNQSIRNLLREQYKINSFGQQRTLVVPINEDGSIKEADDEDEAYFDIPSRLDSTGSVQVDNLISSLHRIADGGKADIIKNEILKAIRSLQIKGSLSNLTKVVNNLSSRITKTVDEFDNLPADATEDQKNEFAIKLQKLVELSKIFKDVSGVFQVVKRQNLPLFKDISKQLKSLERATGLLNSNRERLIVTVNLFTDEFIARPQGVENITLSEKPVRWLPSLFKPLSEAKTRAGQLLSKTYSAITHQVQVEMNKAIKVIASLREEYTKTNRGKNYLESITQKDAKGKYIHKLISKYNRENFTKELNAAIERNDIKWVKDNIDYKAYKEWYSKAKDEYFESVDNNDFAYDEDDNEKKQQEFKDRWEKQFNIDENISESNYKLSEYISDKFLSKEYEALKRDKGAFDLFNYIYEANMRAYKIGALKNKSQAETFIPFIRKELTDKITTNGTFSLLDSTLRNLLTTKEREDVMNIDPLTGREKTTLPFYHTIDISENGDYSNVSQDIFKILPTYIEQIEKYQRLSEKEAEMLLLQETESNKGSITTTMFGKRVEGATDIPNNDTNTKYFTNFLNATFYGHRNMDGKGDTELFKMSGEKRKAVNDALGAKIFTEVKGKLSLNALVDSGNRLFQQKVLGLNIPVPISNFLGGNAQLFVNTNKYFSKWEAYKHEFGTLLGRFSNGKEYKAYAGLIEYFQLLYDGQENKRLADRMSMNKATQTSIPEKIMFMQHLSERPIQAIVAMAMLDNTMVEDGKLININEFIREKYENRFDKPEAERKALEEKMKAEIKTLKETRAIPKIVKIVGDEMTIPGVDRSSQAVTDFVNLAQNETRAITGGGNKENLRQINLTILGRSTMVFHSWIPKLLTNRVQKLSWNEGSQSYDMGRWNAVGAIISDRWVQGAKRLYDVYTMNDRGVELLKEKYEDTKAKYEFENNGEKFKMSKSQYIEMMQDLVKQEMREVLILGTLVGGFMAMGAMQPPDDESQTVYNYFYKTVNKVQGEMSFFYNPMEWVRLGQGSIFPSIGVVKEIISVGNESAKTLNYLVTQDEEMKNKTHLFKATAKIVPVLNQGASSLALFDAELAKELALEIKKPQNQ